MNEGREEVDMREGREGENEVGSRRRKEGEASEGALLRGREMTRG